MDLASFNCRREAFISKTLEFNSCKSDFTKARAKELAEEGAGYIAKGASAVTKETLQTIDWIFGSVPQTSDSDESTSKVDATEAGHPPAAARVECDTVFTVELLAVRSISS